MSNTRLESKNCFSPFSSIDCGFGYIKSIFVGIPFGAYLTSKKRRMGNQMYGNRDHSLNTYLMWSVNIGVNWKPTPQFGTWISNVHNFSYQLHAIIRRIDLDRMPNNIYTIKQEHACENHRLYSFVARICFIVKWNERKTDAGNKCWWKGEETEKNFSSNAMWFGCLCHFSGKL